MRKNKPKTSGSKENEVSNQSTRPVAGEDAIDKMRGEFPQVHVIGPPDAAMHFDPSERRRDDADEKKKDES